MTWRFWRWCRSWRTVDTRILERLARDEYRQGWDGPRWRFPEELKAEARRQRLRRIVEIRSQQ